MKTSLIGFAFCVLIAGCAMPEASTVPTERVEARTGSHIPRKESVERVDVIRGEDYQRGRPGQAGTRGDPR